MYLSDRFTPKLLLRLDQVVIKLNITFRWGLSGEYSVTYFELAWSLLHPGLGSALTI